MHLVIQRTPVHALQGLDRPIHAALLAIPSICRHSLSRCLDEILPQQPVDDVDSRRATLQLSENILATGMAMDTFIGVELLQLLGRSLRGGDDAGPVASSAAIESAAAIEADAAAAYISFESHRRLLQDEEREFQQSRFDVSHKRATCASFLFPDLYPETADAQTRAWDAAQGRQRTRLAPLPVPYDATGAHPLLAPLEAAATSGYAGRLLAAFGLHEQRHRPLFALSTGEARKLMLIHCLLSPPQLLVLDEAFDGLDEPSRAELTAALTAALDDSLGAPAP